MTRPRRAALRVALLAAAVGALTRCADAPTSRRTSLIQQAGIAHFALVAQSTDSVSISVAWSPVTDPSGISQYQWRDTTVSPPGPALSGATPDTVDTFTVVKPAPGARIDHQFQVRAVDGAGNVGPYSAPTPWGIVRLDTAAPPAPSRVYLDTLITLTDVVHVGVWPESVQVDSGRQAQLYAAELMSDGTAYCDASAASADTAVAFNIVQWPGACDSARAVLQRRYYAAERQRLAQRVSAPRRGIGAS